MTSNRAKRVIHYLDAGLPLCRFDSKMPRDWPPGHSWALEPRDRDTQTPEVNCPQCLKLHAAGPGGDLIIGTAVVRIRKMTKEELEREGWNEPSMAVELSSGAIIYASRDEEGNGPGALFGWDGEHTITWHAPLLEAADER
jgi:hypothetical protein